jgi:CHASE3 domain sensor protein
MALEATIKNAARTRMSYLILGGDSDLTEYGTAVSQVQERMRQL